MPLNEYETDVLVVGFGAADGVGSAPLGPPPTRVVFNTPDVFFAAPTENLFVCGLLLPGEIAGTTTTAIGADAAPSATILRDSSFTVSGQQPSTPALFNLALRLLLDGDRATLGGESRAPAQEGPGAHLRVGDRSIAIDRWGRRIE